MRFVKKSPRLRMETVWDGMVQIVTKIYIYMLFEPSHMCIYKFLVTI